MPYTKNPNQPRSRGQAVELVRRGWSTRKVARHLGFSQGAIVQWCKKARFWGFGSIPTKSSRPRSSSKALGPKTVEAIVAERQKHGRCGKAVWLVLKQQGIKVSLSSVQRTLDRHLLLKKKSLWKKWARPVPRPMTAEPGDLVQVDTVHVMKDREKRLYVFTLLDLYSRWSFAKAYPQARAGAAARFVAEAQQHASFVFKHLQTDHGSEFSRYFKQRVQIKHRHSRVRRPNDNAHLERFNRTLREECLNKLPADIKTINRALPKYLNYYKAERIHLGLNGKTPQELLAK